MVKNRKGFIEPVCPYVNVFYMYLQKYFFNGEETWFGHALPRYWEQQSVGGVFGGSCLSLLNWQFYMHTVGEGFDDITCSWYLCIVSSITKEQMTKRSAKS